MKSVSQIEGSSGKPSTRNSIMSLLRLSGEPSIASPRIRSAQLVSCAAGIATLWTALVFLRREADASAKVRYLSLALIALNSGLIGINAQATNDSFVILFVSLALFLGYRFFCRARM